jgi:hypothetical protein
MSARLQAGAMNVRDMSSDKYSLTTIIVFNSNNSSNTNLQSVSIFADMAEDSWRAQLSQRTSDMPFSQIPPPLATESSRSFSLRTHTHTHTHTRALYLQHFLNMLQSSVQQASQVPPPSALLMIPLDWSIKHRVQFTSPYSFAWLQALPTSVQCVGISEFVRQNDFMLPTGVAKKVHSSQSASTATVNSTLRGNSLIVSEGKMSTERF